MSYYSSNQHSTVIKLPSINLNYLNSFICNISNLFNEKIDGVKRFLPEERNIFYTSNLIIIRLMRIKLIQQFISQMK